jgi:hypothetical protein
LTPTIERLYNPAEGVRIIGNPKHIDGLDFSPADDGYIIYQPEQNRVYFLNPTAALILEFCNGRNSPAEIIDLVKQAYGLTDAPAEDVRQALAQLAAEGLLQHKHHTLAS